LSLGHHNVLAVLIALQLVAHLQFVLLAAVVVVLLQTLALIDGPGIPEACRFQVLVEVRFEGEGLVAAMALEVLIARMGLHVGPQIGAVGKGFAAMDTGVGLLAGVGPKVSLE